MGKRASARSEDPFAIRLQNVLLSRLPDDPAPVADFPREGVELEEAKIFENVASLEGENLYGYVRTLTSILADAYDDLSAPDDVSKKSVGDFLSAVAQKSGGVKLVRVNRADNPMSCSSNYVRALAAEPEKVTPKKLKLTPPGEKGASGTPEAGKPAAASRTPEAENTAAASGTPEAEKPAAAAETGDSDLAQFLTMFQTAAPRPPAVADPPWYAAFTAA